MARIKGADNNYSRKKKKKDKLVDASTLDPAILDRMRSTVKSAREQLSKEAEDNRNMSTEDMSKKVMSEAKLSSMSDEQAQKLKEELVAKKSGANTNPAKDMAGKDKLLQEKEDAPIDDSEIDAEEAEMDKEELEDLAPEDRVGYKPPGTKEEPSMFGVKNFKQAFSFFGPRLAAMLIGGSEALETTDDMLTSYEDRMGGNIDPVTRERLRLANERLKLQKKGESGRQGRFDAAMKYKERMAERPGGKIMLEQAAQKTLLNHLDALEKLSASVDQNFRGPLSGLGKDWAVKFGLSNDEDWAAFSARSNMVLNSYIKAITGAQSGAEEQARLGKDVPSPRDTPTLFAAKVKMMREAVEGRIESVNSELEKYGFKAEDGSFTGKGLTKEMREHNANIVSKAISKQLTALAEEDKKNNAKAKPQVVKRSQVPVGRKFKQGGKIYLMTENGPQEVK